MHEHNVLLQDDVAATGEDTAQPSRGVHWAFYVAGIGIGIMIFLLAVLVLVYLRAG
jgi:hypothetical protein